MHSSTILILSLTALATARTDLVGCTSSTAGPSLVWYVPGTGELCDFLDCGGGRAPPKTTVPGCPQYAGTATYSPSFLPGFGAAASTTAAVSASEPLITGSASNSGAAGAGSQSLATSTVTSTSISISATAAAGSSQASSPSSSAASLASTITSTDSGASGSAAQTGSASSGSSQLSSASVSASSSASGTATGTAASATNSGNAGVVNAANGLVGALAAGLAFLL